MGIQSINSIIPIFNTDSQGNQTSIIIQNETKQVIDGMLVLTQIPDKNNRVIIDNMIEIPLDATSIAEDEFKVDYTSGILHFHTNKNGQNITISQYYGRGVIMIPYERIYTRTSDGGTIITTLADAVDEALNLVNSSVELVHKGDYSNTTTYYRLNMVTYDQKTFICIDTNVNGITGVLPTDTNSWKLLISIEDLVNEVNTIKQEADLAVQNATNAVQDAVNLVNVSLNVDYKGVYDNTTTYFMPNIVKYNNKNYVCIDDNPNGVTGVLPTDILSWDEIPIDTSNWDVVIEILQQLNNIDVAQQNLDTSIVNLTNNVQNLITPVENYDNTKQYYVNNRVVFNGSSYECILDSLGNLPTNTTYWICYARSGEVAGSEGLMLIAEYDSDGDGKVDYAENADTVPWTGVTNPPTGDYIGHYHTTDRNRANHTGTQAVSTITGLATVATSGEYGDLLNPPDLTAKLDTTTFNTFKGTVEKFKISDVKNDADGEPDGTILFYTGS
jgi:hypothetical protein